MLSLVLSALVGCGSPEPLIRCAQLTDTDPEGAAKYGSNVLVIMSDDIGIDKTGTYAAHPDPALTPNIDQLACAGIVFTNAYANPVCSSSRAALLTGRHGTRTGIGRWIYAETTTEESDLKLSEVTIPEMLEKSAFGYTSAAVGKWHLVGFERNTDPATHPNDQGFSYYAGAIGNPLDAIQEGNTPRSYENWEKVTNGEPEWVTTYMSTDTANEAVQQIQTLPEPWFLYVAFNGAHEPVHKPPQSLITTDTDELTSDLEKFNAMVEATDTEIGRVIASIPPDVLARTTIIYLTDNGTPDFGIAEPWDNTRGKGTLFEGGINVPMIVTGPLVEQPDRFEDALVHFVDLFPTIAEIAEVSADEQDVEIDGVSFLAQLQAPDVPQERAAVYSEKFYPNGAPPYSYHHRMVTNGQWKLVRSEDGGVTESLYRIDPWLEGADKIDTVGRDPWATAAYELLSGEMADRMENLEYAE